jgi:transglutaminase-like putative cysteine protease
MAGKMTPALALRLRTIPDGDAGTRATLYAMRAIVRESVTVPAVRAVAVRLAMEVAPGNTRGIIDAISDYCHRVIHFTRDPLGVEQLHYPEVMLAMIERVGRVGVDCDDAAMLVAVLAESVGVPARFSAVAFVDRAAPFSHVYAELSDGLGWRIVDPTRPAQRLDTVAVTRIMRLDV